MEFLIGSFLGAATGVVTENRRLYTVVIRLSLTGSASVGIIAKIGPLALVEWRTAYIYCDMKQGAAKFGSKFD